ncbi:galactose mutarotase [Flavobacterium franklandianum]|uniref:Aldose 1-epimerase n=1 Tax=Flavobacterium franklandianum TaxID=2594430 RepID=A0A553CLB8_9FLAO|nr:aldose epimerase family protein [Flavobacterium franklandianum]TRX21261.1 galactose mutarotase [Flavobacterium franklandianum]TRX30089.1 galactose mutarotase [Flavobacterium franklandianum]
MKKAILIMSFLFISLTTLGQKNTHTSITLLNKSDFETEIDGKQVRLYTLKNHSGMISEITNYGGKVVSLWTPDRKGHYEDIVLGYSNIKDYLKSKEKYFGALIGRYGNRIANGKFALNGKEYDLAKNNGLNHLHGGNKGLESVVWDAKQVDGQTLELRYISKNREEGYPGNLTIKVVYKLTDNNELKIEYWASTDEPTVINLTHHSFFNLKGAGNGTINNHLLQINAAYYTPVDNGLIPTGEIASVENSPFDFQKMIEIGQRVDTENQQLKYGLGYDLNFVLNQKLEGLNYAAKVIEPVSGRTMEVYTNEPGLQFYGGNFLNGTETGKNSKLYEYRVAFCLETQHFPDSPNKIHFPTTILNPRDEYYSICIYKFFVSK